MLAALRPYVTAGVALVGSSLIAVIPMTQSLPDSPVEHLATRLVDTSSSIANIPVNLGIDIVNIPYYESLALDEYAYALGPAGSVGGVPGWIPPGTAPTGIETINGLPYYALGGTGSWDGESIGNTWGWDNGNWPQLDAILHFFLPFPFTEALAEQIQTLAQAEIIDGAAVNCEFECANDLGYVGGWFRTPLTQLLSGYTYPNVLADTIGMNSPTGVINVGPTPPGTDLVIWSGQHVTLDPLAPLAALAANLTGSPANNPIMFPDPATVIENVIKLSQELNYIDFTAFYAQGSFLYWGAPTLYSVPAALGGLVQSLTGIPNQFLISPWQPNGAEPITGYNASLPQLVEGLPQGFEYLLKGLLGYLSPTLAADLSGPLNALGNLGTLPADLLESTGIANLWTQLTTTLPRTLADLNTQVAQGLSSLLSGLGGVSLPTLVNSPSGTASTGSSGTKSASTMSANLLSTPTSSGGQSQTVASEVVQTPTPKTPVDKPHWTGPTPAKVTIPASINGTNASINGTNASINGTTSTANHVMGGKLNNVTSDGNKVEPGQSFGEKIGSAVSKALRGVNGGAAKVPVTHHK